MYIVSETSDWTDTFDYSANNGGFIQPGYSVSGTVGGSDTGDFIRTSMAYDQPYTFVLEGEGVSFEMLDDGNPVVAEVNGNSLTYATTHPSDFADIRVTGNGSYTVTMVGIAADYLDDEDSGMMTGAPDFEIGTSITGVINGSDGIRETDYYRIELFAGQTYSFVMTQADAPYGATSGGQMQMLDEDGVAVTSGYSYDASAWGGATYEFTPSVAGTYFLTADTYFGSFGAYTINSATGDAPEVIANIDAVDASGSAGTTFVTVRVALDTPAAEAISGTVSLTAADVDYSRAASTVDAEFTIEAGANFVDVTIAAGSEADFGEDTVFVARIAEVGDAMIGQGFLVSETYSSGATNTATDGDDVLTGTRGRDSIDALGGDDHISGLGGRDLLLAGTGDDTVNAGNGNDIVRAGSGNDLLSGGGGKDRLIGNAGQDELSGNAGNDRLFGNGGADRLIGGAGDDLLIGGGQADTFVFFGAFGHDTIRDFNSHKRAEKIDLSALEEITNLRDLRNNHMSQDGGDVVIEDGNGNTITLLDVGMADLGSSDFIF